MDRRSFVLGTAAGGETAYAVCDEKGYRYFVLKPLLRGNPAN